MELAAGRFPRQVRTGLMKRTLGNKHPVAMAIAVSLALLGAGSVVACTRGRHLGHERRARIGCWLAPYPHERGQDQQAAQARRAQQPASPASEATAERVDQGAHRRVAIGGGEAERASQGAEQPPRQPWCLF